MKHLGKRFLSMALTAAMVLALLPGAMVANAAETEYEIYPTPHEIVYGEGSFEISSEVDVTYDEGIDEVTKNRLEEILASKGIEVSSEDKGTHTKILVEIDDTLDDGFDAHTVVAEDQVIAVTGKDTDAAFYGLTTLMHIFNQMEGNEIREFAINDYADTATRGFIEGYYGIPWSNEDRMSLMEFGGNFKMTSYVFAPKDDPYHTSKWRELYPEEEIAAIAEMVEVGNSVKCRFVWTAHPFMGGFNSNDVDGEIESLLAKFEQLYSVGVRQFGVLGDDVDSLNKDIVIQVMTAVSEWAAEKGDVYDSVFCPAGYNHSWQGNYSELNTYDAGFPDDIQIFWTGEAVCQPVEVKTLDHFRNYNATNGQRRAPLFWLNWPVNDINMARLMMGKGSLLRTDVNPEDLKGVVTNPMQDAECSKVALFAVADYAWNIADFDDDASWADCFKYIDADASEELHTLAKHMSNPQPNGHGLVLAESEELQPLINEFKSALANGQSLAGLAEELAAEMDVIIAACDDFHTKSKNEDMKEEILPFSNALKDTATAIKYYALAALDLENGDDLAAFEAFMVGYGAAASSTTHMRPTLSGSKAAEPGSTHLIPLMEDIEEAIVDEITEYALGGTDSDAPVSFEGTSSFTSYYEGTGANIVDGDANTYAWYDGYEAAGQYYQVNLSKPATVYGIEILNGTSSKLDDTFGNAKLQYTTDGTNWQDVNGEIYSNYPQTVTVEDIAIENVKAVRYICTSAGSGNKWPSMREFTVITENAEATGKAYTNAEAYAEAEAVYGEDTNYLVPIEVTLAEGEYIGLELDRIHELDFITVNEGQIPEGFALEISANELEWTEAESDVWGLYAKYIRLIRVASGEATADISEFAVVTNELSDKSLSETNYSSIDGEHLAVFDGDWTTAVQYANSQVAGKYFVYDLGQEIAMDSFKVVCTDSEWDYPRHGKFSVSTDGETWTEIMTLGNQDSDNNGEAAGEDEIGSVLPDHEISYNTKSVTDLGVYARYLKFEITRTKTGPDKWVRFQELEINGGAYIPTENDPTFESTAGEDFAYKYDAMADRSLATAYAPAAEEGVLYYHVSKPGMNNVKVIQNGISDAVVEVRTMAAPDEWVYLGTLSESISVLKCDGEAATEILDVKISWEDTNISIIELIVMAGEYGDALPDRPVEKPDPQPPVNPFDDVSEADYFYNAVLWAVENNVTTGDTETLFAPYKECNRGQIVLFLYRALNGEAVDTENPFSDVSEADYCYDAVLWAVENGITNGITATTFEPWTACSRAEIVTFLWRAMGSEKVATDKVFEDVNPADFFYDAVAWAVENGVTTGLNDTSFGAWANCFRCDAVTFIQRAVEK